MTAYESAHMMGRENAWKKVEEAGIFNYGYHRFLLSDLRDSKPKAIVAALDNGDLSHVYKQILFENPENVVEGLAVMGFLTGADCLSIQLPDEDADKVGQLHDILGRYDIRVDFGFVNVRSHDSDLLIHYGTAAILASLFTDGMPQQNRIAVKKGDTVGPLLHVPYGTSVRDLIGEEADVKAFSLGNHLYPASEEDMTIDAETETGDGLLCIYPDKACMVHETAERLGSFRDESCGKCTFCREGLYQLCTITSDMTRGASRDGDIDLMTETGKLMKDSCRCTLGSAAPDYLLDALDRFPDEFENHALRRQCPNGVCKGLLNLYIDPQKCTGCGSCMDVCQSEAIDGRSGYIHMIIKADCSRCGACVDACPEHAVVQTSGRMPKLPRKLTKVGRFHSH